MVTTLSVGVIRYMSHSRNHTKEEKDVGNYLNNVVSFMNHIHVTTRYLYVLHAHTSMEATCMDIGQEEKEEEMAAEEEEDEENKEDE